MPENLQQPTRANPGEAPGLPIAPAAETNTSIAGSQPPACIPDHELLRCIGRGSYGEVWLARSVVGTWRAVKVVRRATFERVEHFEREFKGIQRFEPISRAHEGFVDILQIGRNEEAGYFYYVMELADSVTSNQRSVISSRAPEVPTAAGSVPSLNADLRVTDYSPRTLRAEQQRRTRLPVSDCVDIGVTLASALAYLHQHGLVHRDVKPSNIIFVGGVPKLADIGLVADASEARSFVGTVGFIPPEGPGSPQADLYSLGKVLYEISTGKDRQNFPHLPGDLLGEHSQQGAADRVGDDSFAESKFLGARHDAVRMRVFVELNAILLKACQPDARARYESAARMRSELEMLQRGESIRRKRSIERRLIRAKKASLAAAAIVALLALLPYVKLGKSPRNGAQVVEIASLAVLPFVNESKSVRHEYLSDALTDEAMGAFTNIAGLRVASRPSVFVFKGTNADPRQIGEQLGVRAVLAGMFLRSSNDMRLKARLVNVADGAELWSSSYQGQDADVANGQSEVVRQVTRRLNLSLDARALRRLESNLVRKLAGYQLFSKASRFPRNTRDGLTEATELLNQAILTDPDFALAYGYLAQVYREAAGWHLPWKQALTEAKKNAAQAIHLDSTLASAHLSMAQVLFLLDGDWAGAEAAFERAVALDPRSAFARAWFGGMLSAIGRFEKADEMLKRAEELEPKTQEVLTQLGWRYFIERRFQESLAYALRVRSLFPDDVIGYQLLASVQTRLGNFDDALAAAEKARQLDPAPDLIVLVGIVHARAGRRAQAEVILRELDADSKKVHVDPTFQAWIYAALGDVDKVVEHLKIKHAEKPLRSEQMRTTRQWDFVREDPRFVEMLRNMGLEK